MKWQIKFYKNNRSEEPVIDFIESLSIKEQAKVLDIINLLKENGIYLGFPYVSSITGSKGLKELRIKFSSNQIRIIYFLYIDNTFILLHAFKKKTDKIPEKELEIAKRRMKEVI